MNPHAKAAEVAGRLTKAQRAMVIARHTEAGNPWPFIGIRERAGGAKNRTFSRMKLDGLYDWGNCLTPLGLEVRSILLSEGNEK